MEFVQFFSVSVVGVPVGITRASFTLIFSLTAGIIKKLLSITRNKKEKHGKILMLTKSKLNSIEALVPQALVYMEISLKEFITILREKDKYEKMKGNLRNMSEKLEKIENIENIRFNSINSKTLVKKNPKNYLSFDAIDFFFFFFMHGEFKKRRHKIQDCEDFQPCRKFIGN